jgi:hypothetical protein
MTEPNRVLGRLREESGSPLQGALLRAGREVVASEAARVGVLEALGLVQGQIGGARMPSSYFRRGGLLLAAMVVSAAAVAIPIARRALMAGPPAASIAQQDPGASAKTPEIAEVPGGSETDSAPLATNGTNLRSPKSVAGADESGAVRTAAHAVGRNALAAELAALDAARAKLNNGEPRAALVLLDSYQRDFPKPRLALEAEVLRIDALDRGGQTEAARKRAAAFVQSHPKGVLTGRVRRYLEK